MRYIQSVGFTGTRQGMSHEQKMQLRLLLRSILGGTKTFNHGGAIGADRQAASLVKLFVPRVDAVCFPAGRDPLGRNRKIVAASQILIAAPATDEEIIRSGTWATVRYARAAGIPVIHLSRGE
jgi:hypothetical protein